MRDNCIVAAMTRRRALFDINENDFCFMAYGDHIMKPIF